MVGWLAFGYAYKENVFRLRLGRKIDLDGYLLVLQFAELVELETGLLVLFLVQRVLVVQYWAYFVSERVLVCLLLPVSGYFF